MNKPIILLFLLGIFACKQAPKAEKVEEPVPQEMTESKPRYPDAMVQVFEAHGGIKKWKEQRTLSFVIPKPDLPEIYTIDLWSRMNRVDTEMVSRGMDDQDVWLLDTGNSYKGDARFANNLMFYFYAMPFVLGDTGIVYSEADDLEFEGKSFPGVKIGFQSGVGDSSKDEYFIHYDPETFQMAWLGYTVTYRSGESSDNVKWIRYDDWQEVNGILLPNSISWFTLEDGNLIEPRNTVTFNEVTLSENPKPKDYYLKPEGAKYVPVKN
ncbi:DUF6503 family protein [Allomuricauda sp. F6463D]|uniref:DUF6503 family protein n=1 Tax=Allomuricauda sp. F6463D TaxID=2926409 RepID=UPI001FF1DFB1|nr:DUF6503 family protein [Muricauda sp. F6463D]MCK0160209.1 hypothetical protein [Muricauda sp. F6463D]